MWKSGPSFVFPSALNVLCGRHSSALGRRKMHRVHWARCSFWIHPFTTQWSECVWLLTELLPLTVYLSHTWSLTLHNVYLIPRWHKQSQEEWQEPQSLGDTYVQWPSVFCAPDAIRRQVPYNFQPCGIDLVFPVENMSHSKRSSLKRESTGLCPWDARLGSPTLGGWVNFPNSHSLLSETAGYKQCF